MPSAEVGALRVRLTMDAGEFEAGAKNAESRLGAMSQKFKAFGKAATKVGVGLSAGVTAPILAFAKSSIGAFQTQEAAILKVNQALKSMGDASGFTSAELQKMASGMQDLTNFGDEDILQKVTGNLLTFGQIAGDEFARTQQVALDLSAALGQDLQTSTIQLGKALNDPVSNLGALGRVGISFTTEQENMIKAMAKANDMAGAQKIILGELEAQYGGQAAAARNVTGNLQPLINSWGDFQEKIGELAAKFLPPLIEVLTKAVNFLNNLDESSLKWIATIGALAAVLGPIALTIGALAAVGGPILLLVSAIGAVIAVVIQFKDEIFATFNAVQEFLTAKIGVIVETFTSLKDGVVGTFTSMFDTIIGNSIVPEMVDGVNMEFDRMNDHIAMSMDNTHQVVQRGFSRMSGMSTQLFLGMANDLVRIQKALFGDSKAAAIAQAVISTAVGITRALESLPFPANIAAAAAVAAEGALQVATIKNTRIGGGAQKAGGAGGAGGGSAAAGPTSTLVVEGLSADTILSGATVGPLIEKLLAAQADGAQVVLAR